MAQEEAHGHLVGVEVLEVCRGSWKFLDSLCCTQGQSGESRNKYIRGSPDDISVSET